MIVFKDNILNEVNKWNDNYYVLTDFDRTITVGNSESSWGVLSKSNMVSEDYVKERKELYDYYHPFEINLDLDYETKNKMMIEWWNKHINLFVKYQLEESVVNDAARNLRVMNFRDGAQEFLKAMYKKNIPVIIISAGIGNFVKEFLVKNDSMYDNIYIIANFIEFKNGIAVGVSNNIIHSLNKNEVALPDNIKELIKNRENIVLLGDSIDDIKMVSDEKRDRALKIGFLNENANNNRDTYLEKFDIVCDENSSFYELTEKLDIFKLERNK